MVAVVEGTVSAGGDAVADATLTLWADPEGQCPAATEESGAGLLDVTTGAGGTFQESLVVWDPPADVTCIGVRITEPVDTAFSTAPVRLRREGEEPDTVRVEIDLPV